MLLGPMIRPRSSLILISGTSPVQDREHVKMAIAIYLCAFVVICSPPKIVMNPHLIPRSNFDVLPPIVLFLKDWNTYLGWIVLLRVRLLTQLTWSRYSNLLQVVCGDLQAAAYVFMGRCKAISAYAMEACVLIKFLYSMSEFCSQCFWCWRSTPLLPLYPRIVFGMPLLRASLFPTFYGAVMNGQPY
jgi:hypothetical protein